MSLLSKNKWFFTIIAFVFFSTTQHTKAQESQTELLKDFTATSLNIFKVKGEKFEKVSKPWPITLEKKGENISKLVINRAGIIEEAYEPDLLTYPAYFKDLKHRVVFVDDNFYYIKWSGGKATIKYILTENESVDKDYDKHTEKIEYYVRKTVAAQTEGRAELAIIKEKQAAADKIANSLKGKKVKSIAVEWLDKTQETGHLVKVPYGIVATLADGRLLKTSNLDGKMPWDDFKITVKGGDYGQELITIAENADVIPNDNLVVTVQSKFLSHIKTTAKLPVHYSNSLHVNFIGGNGGINKLNVSPGYKGHDGKSLEVYVSQVKTGNGETVNQIEIKDAITGKTLRRLKMKSNATLIINNWGGNGSYGTGGTQGGNGGNGGSVTIIKSSMVQKFTYIVNNKGGSGGNHDSSELL